MDGQGQLADADPSTLFELAERIGKGQFGVVHRARSKTSNEIVAIKKIKIDNKEIAENIAKELEIHKSVSDCPQIVSFNGSFVKATQLWISLEFCDAGSVRSILRKTRKPLPEDCICWILHEVLVGLLHLHSLKIAHRDIKADNILLTTEGHIKISDFGISINLNSDAEKFDLTMGSPYWMAPEIIKHEEYNEKVDIWSLGITSIEMADLKPPYFDLLPMSALFQIADESNPPPQPSVLLGWSPDFLDFISKCCTRDPSQRPSAQQLLEHNFFSSRIPALTTEVNELKLSLVNLIAKTLKPVDGFDKSKVEIPHSTANSSYENILGQGSGTSSPISTSDPTPTMEATPVKLNEKKSNASDAISKIVDLVQLMRDKHKGLSIKKRYYHFKGYSSCFVGNDAVDWMCSTLKLKNRKEAIMIGQTLMHRGIIQHVSGSKPKPFMDKPFLYRFSMDAKGPAKSHKSSAPPSVTNLVAGLDEEKIIELVNKMCHPETGVSIKNRKHIIRKYVNCFLGSEAVTWLMKEYPHELNSRTKAVQFAQSLMDRGVIVSVASTILNLGRENYEDRDNFFYRFSSQTAETHSNLSSNELHKIFDKILGDNPIRHSMATPLVDSTNLPCVKINEPQKSAPLPHKHLSKINECKFSSTSNVLSAGLQFTKGPNSKVYRLSFEK